MLVDLSDCFRLTRPMGEGYDSRKQLLLSLLASAHRNIDGAFCLCQTSDRRRK